MFDWRACSVVPLQPAAREVLAALTPVLTRWGRWYLFGAQAVIVHGVPRLSADLDVTLALQPDAPDRFATDMTAAGFRLRLSDPEFVARTRVMPFIHDATGMPIDVVLAASGLEEDFLSRAELIDLGSAKVPVIQVADLIIAKILAGRPKDIDDVKALWIIHGAMADAGRIRHVLTMLQEALSQSDLVPVFDAIVRETKR